MSKTITTRHTLAYGSANLLGSGALAISGAWLMYFYTTFCGLSVVDSSHYLFNRQYSRCNQQPGNGLYH
ncbi:transport protein [Yersinia enterocolitica]|nr:transport protein [Yersinia enterocolitica]